MSLGRQLLNDADPCDVSRRWKLDPRAAELAVRLAALFKERTGSELFIISGYRNPEKQRLLARQGRPAAPVALSTHTSCPATGFDVQTAIAATTNVRAMLGAASAHLPELRWGGGSPPDETGFLPSDWNHFDLGPRDDAEAREFRTQMRSP